MWAYCYTRNSFTMESIKTRLNCHFIFASCSIFSLFFSNQKYAYLRVVISVNFQKPLELNSLFILPAKLWSPRLFLQPWKQLPMSKTAELQYWLIHIYCSILSGRRLIVPISFCSMTMSPNNQPVIEKYLQQQAEQKILQQMVWSPQSPDLNIM